MSAHSATLPRSTWLLVALLTLGWGMNWPMMKLAVAEIPVWTFRGLCCAAGAAGMFVIARAGGMRIRIAREQWVPIMLTALFNVTLWNAFVTSGVRLLPAGRSAILAYTMPLWTVLLSRFILGEALTVRRITGVALGMCGLALLLGDSLVAIGGAPAGAFMIVFAALCWSTGTVLMKRFSLPIPTTVFTGWNLFLGGIPLGVIALVVDPPHWHPIGPSAVVGLVYNMIVAFIVCHWLWFRIVSLAPAGVSALGTLMIPVVGVTSGMLILGERPGWTEFSALTLILAALATVLIPSRRQETPATGR